MSDWGPLGDKPDVCNARIFLADDFGDGTATFRCGLKPGHTGNHEERFERRGSVVLLTWAVDERHDCPEHGLQSGDWCRACCEMAACKCLEDGVKCPDDGLDDG